jgi:threonine synthase
MGVIQRFADRLPVGPNTPRITLGEGGTPLVKAARLGEKLGVELYFKFEGMNPTGSFKDRGMCVAVAKAIEDGYEGIVCASTGNTAASAAAYGARAGLTAVVLTPQGAIAAAKSAQSRAVAAKVAEVNGSFDQALKVCLELADRGVLMLVNSLNPHRIEGQKTAVFEIVEELGRAPDVLALPYGGGGNSVAYAKGFAEEGASTRMVSVQAAERATTLASAIRIAEPAHLDEVDELIANGRVELVTVDDGAITAAWLEIASNEGLFCEPSSAAGYAGLGQVELEPGSTVVAVLTGHGLKDTAAVDVLAEPTIIVQPNVESILAGVAR